MTRYRGPGTVKEEVNHIMKDEPSRNEERQWLLEDIGRFRESRDEWRKRAIHGLVAGFIFGGCFGFIAGWITRMLIN